MPSEQLGILIESLRQNPPLHGENVLEMRAHLDALTANLPPPEGAAIETVDADGVAAEWVIPEDSAPSRTIVYFHGGGYAIGSLSSHRALAARMARVAEARVLNVAYRLGPEHPYPAAVDDAVTAYRFVVAGGTSPDRIALAGDSAGGGLTAAALLALRDAGDALPAAGVCLSPWMDLACTGSSWQTNAALDPVVSRKHLDLLADAYLAGADPKAETASPLYADLRGLPPLLIQVGSTEVLLDDARAFTDSARSAGVEVELDVCEGAPHVWHAFIDILPEADDAVDAIAAFLRSRIA